MLWMIKHFVMSHQQFQNKHGAQKYFYFHERRQFHNFLYAIYEIGVPRGPKVMQLLAQYSIRDVANHSRKNLALYFFKIGAP